MKALVVDDDQGKSRAIVETLEQSLDTQQQDSVTVTSTLANALRVMSLVSFDLIVLDLILPYVPGGKADSRAGFELLRQLRSEDGPNKTTVVVGISAFPDEIAAFRARFDELGVLIIQFDNEGSWSRSLLRVLEDVHARADTQTALDFVIVCALEEERAGFGRTALKKVSEAIVSGLNVHYSRLSEPELFGAIVRLSQMGLVAATFETASVLKAFRTKVLCMSGVCAGFAKEVSLGQVVIASPAWEYQAGKWSKNGFEIAPMQVPLLPTTRSVIDQEIARESFGHYLEAGVTVGEARPLRQSRSILAPFATGSAVIADETRLQHIIQQHRKVAALDMETFGLYFAAHETNNPVDHFFSAKCVVDLADDKKGDDLHSYGCMVSARATERLIRALIVPG
jgi:nucleoside phosphorylase